MKLLIGLSGFIITMIGVILSIHLDFTVGLLVTFLGVFMFWAMLPNTYGNYQANIWNYFCNQGCLMDFIQTHSQAIRAIAPRRQALETPIKVEKEKYESYRYRHNNNGDYVRTPYQATRTTIKSVDNNNG
jgi:uncharacterized membrane protein YgaE (UPF0421/DUF939 family)